MIVFVILHYKNIHDTLECIDSIQRLYLENYKIVVVENGSLDSSTDVLKKMKDNIDVIFNDKNYGFAKGNNIGIRYAKNKFAPDYYIVINNDIIIQQKDIVDEIYIVDQVYNFDVMGPKIVSRNNINQNPNYQVLYKTKDIIKHLFRLNVISLLIIMHLYNFILKLRSNITKKYVREGTDQIVTDIPLHGSALVFSKKYVNQYNEPFDESTFLYGEEEFLNYRRVRDGLKFIYVPSIEVFHKEDASLDELFKDNDIEKTKFVIRNSKHSLMKLLSQKFKDKNMSR